MKKRFSFLLFSLCFLFSNLIFSQNDEIKYPYGVKYLNIVVENVPLKMAYMDENPVNSNGKTVLLLHGKNFNGYYWKSVMSWLLGQGYRVVVPDQVGWGKSSRPPMIHYSFSMLANNTKILLDSLGISKVSVIAHSMGGMLGTRFALQFPDKVTKMVLENPIGLEDYKTFVPYRTIEDQFRSEQQQTFQSYHKYQQSYYPEWKPEYEDLVRVQAADLHAPDFKNIAFVNAVTYDMIYNQPVCYEFRNLRVPVLLIIGQADRTIVGKNLLGDETAQTHGQYPALGDKTVKEIANAQIVRLPGVGHIPHIQSLKEFQMALMQFLAGK